MQSAERGEVEMVDVSVILPTYCERGNIGRLVQALQTCLAEAGWQSEILVVDDNSPDGTAQEVQNVPLQAGVRVHCLVRTEERGLASAIRYGIERAGGQRVVVMDTDFNHSPSNLPEMIRALDTNDLVIGSRFVRGGGMEDRKRYFFSLAYNQLVRLLLWQKVNDNLSGFFAMRRAPLFKLDFDYIFNGYGEYFIRLIVLAQKNGCKVLELPVFYTLRKEGESKSHFGSMILDYTRCVVDLWKYRKAR